VTVGDRLRRRVIPRAVVMQSRVNWPARTGASLRRGFGQAGCVELYFAFDDPESAVALVELVRRVERRDVTLRLLPVVERGIPGDPAVERKRSYAVVDARRLAARYGLTLSRAEPLDPELVAPIAEWVSATPQTPPLIDFCEAAMRELWFRGDGPVPLNELAGAWRDCFGEDPPLAPGREPVRQNERAMRRRGPYDTPAAWVHGQWFFAHERLDQIEHRLDELGWRAAG